MKHFTVVNGKWDVSYNPDPPDLKILKHLIDYTTEHEWSDTKSCRQLNQNAIIVGKALGLDRDIGTVNVFEINEMITEFRQRGNTNSTINRKLAALSKLFTTAIDLELITKKPRIRKLREKANNIRWYTDEELKAIEEFLAPTGDWRLNPERFQDKEESALYFAHLVRFLADTGLRLGEAERLRWDDIFDNSPFVTVWESKNGKPRSVPLTKAAKNALDSLAAHPELSPGKGPFDRSRTHHQNCWKVVREHMGWLEDKQAVMHTLRHTFISRLVQKGVNLVTIKELAGHKSIDVTMRYAHLAPDNLQSAIDQLN